MKVDTLHHITSRHITFCPTSDRKQSARRIGNGRKPRFPGKHEFDIEFSSCIEVKGGGN